MHGSHASTKVMEFLLENCMIWNVLEIYLQGPGKSWNLLGSDADGSFWLQLDMFLQMKIAIIVATRYVFWAAGMPKCFRGQGSAPVHAGGTYGAPQAP